MILRADRAAGMLDRRHIEWLTDACLCENIAAKKLIRRLVRDNFSLIHDHDPVHIPVKHILQTVLDDDHRLILLSADAVDQVNGCLPGCRIEIRERLIKQKNFHIINQNTAHRDALLLSA